MTEAARRVLGDCKAALDMLEDEEHEQRWRVLWVGAMALLRAVGHVLRKVDGEDARLRPLIDAVYDSWKANRSTNAVFWKFIEEERNNVLKEYRFNVLDSAEVGLCVVEVLGGPESSQALVHETPFALGENLFRPVTEGFGAGEDGRDVYRQAMKWWDAELFRIEAGLAASKR